MPSFVVSLSWIIISPLAFLTNFLGVLIILHYKPLYHSCDVAFMSLLVTMATNAWLLLPVPAVMELGDIYWTKGLCAFYTWLSITLRSAHLLVLLVVNVYWMASIRVSSRKRMFTASIPMKTSIGVCWFIAIVAGLIPAVDTGQIFHYYEDGACKFLPSSVSSGFAIFFIIICLLSSIMGVISSLDTLLIFRSMKDVALTKYNADRFHVPTISGSLQTGSIIHAKYNELNVSLELCRLVLWFSIASSVLNAIPLLSSQFVQLIQEYDRDTMETTLLWLLLVESLTLPHLLWMLSKRYRHATVYTWKVFVLRDNSIKEEDTESCTLQNYRLNDKIVTCRPYMNGITLRQVNGHAPGAGTEYPNREADTEIDNGLIMSQMNGQNGSRPIISQNGGINESSTDLEDGLTAVTHLPSSVAVVVHDKNREENMHQQLRSNNYNTNSYETSPNFRDDNQPSNMNSRVISLGSESDGKSYKPITSSGSNNSPLKIVQGQTGQVKRSISTSSRTEWKDRMRKKHLPGVFINGSLEDDYNSDHIDQSSPEILNENEILNRHSSPGGHHGIVNHTTTQRASTDSVFINYDYLNDTSNRGHPQIDDDDDEIMNSYEDEDIKNILDGSFRHSLGKTDHQLNSNNQVTIKSNNVNINTGHASLNMAPNTETNSFAVSKTHEPGSNPAKNGVKKYSENIGNNFVKTNVLLSEKCSINDEYSNRLQVSRQSESSIRSTANCIIASFKYPSIRRNNYRKFLPYTDLIISNVDSNNDDDNEKGDVYKTMENVRPSSENSVQLLVNNLESDVQKSDRKFLVPEDSRNIRKEPTWNRNTEPDVFVTEPVGMLTGPVRTVTEPDLSVTDNFVQDFNKLENVSGSEMLLLKMRSIRSAIAFYNSDDTTSDEGGLDNRGFDVSEDTSNDDDFDDNRQDYSKHNSVYGASRNGNLHKQIDLKLRSLGSGHSSPATSTKYKLYEVAEEDLERYGSGDGEESAVDSDSYDATTSFRNGAGKYDNSLNSVYPSLNAKTPDILLSVTNKNSPQLHHKQYITNSLKDEPTSSLSKTTQKLNLDVNSVSNSKKSSFNNTMVSSSKGDYGVNILQAGYMPKVYHIPHADFVDVDQAQRVSTTIVRPVREGHLLADGSNSTSNVSPVKTGPLRASNAVSASNVRPVREGHLLADGSNSTSNLSPVKTGHLVSLNVDPATIVSPVRSGKLTAPIAKPPRHRKQSDPTSLDRIHITNGVFDSTAPETRAIPEIKNSPFAAHPNSENKLDTNESNVIEILNTSDISETDSSDSEHSVTIEPYGHRRPLWMNDSLLSSRFDQNDLSREDITNTRDRGISSVDELSTNFTSKYNQNVQVYDKKQNFDVDERSSGSNKNQDSMNHRFQDPLIEYRFDEDINDVFENDDININRVNSYRNRSLCFEAIEEEPEDSLSDSSTSCTHSDSGIINVLNPQPVDSRSGSSPRVTRISPVELTHSSLEGRNGLISASHNPNLKLEILKYDRDQSIIPTSERTSADGSETIPPTYTSNGKHAITSLGPTQIVGHTSNNYKPHYDNVTNINKTGKSTETIKLLEHKSPKKIRPISSMPYRDVHARIIRPGILESDINKPVDRTDMKMHDTKNNDGSSAKIRNRLQEVVKATNSSQSGEINNASTPTLGSSIAYF